MQANKNYTQQNEKQNVNTQQVIMFTGFYHFSRDIRATFYI